MLGHQLWTLRWHFQVYIRWCATTVTTSVWMASCIVQPCRRQGNAKTARGHVYHKMPFRNRERRVHPMFMKLATYFFNFLAATRAKTSLRPRGSPSVHGPKRLERRGGQGQRVCWFWATNNEPVSHLQKTRIQKKRSSLPAIDTTFIFDVYL